MSNLVSLYDTLSLSYTAIFVILRNASSNEISGYLPDCLGASSLVSLDLSNALEGPIPSWLGSPRMQHLRLDNNRLSGPVPESIYAIGVHGGYINLAGNQGLCGLPECPFQWKQGGMSPAAKAVLVMGVLVAAAILAGRAYYYIQRRNAREDCNFNLPHQLVECWRRKMGVTSTELEYIL